ncbi:unnamed protein product [Chrysodeixis includens]|uniref:Uncharacterized protein n=1 Tax=Chrysodeixis includens TaxID=689277 RepID=A0A9P0FUD9_CHRIL|nr:unnamed protein product [Chrysodeixis includens]
MSCYSKEKCAGEKYDYNNVCKSHSARSDRDQSSAVTFTELYRICPSKLSKRELEDLYFALLENNLELKKTVNGQQDKIRVLSTKVQRLTASQKLIQSREMKDCCMGTKTLVNDQKESIQDLKRTNQRMTERIRMLNMRLSSAKQFHKRSPPPSMSRCPRCANMAPPLHHYPIHSCSPKPSEPTNQTIETMNVSSQNVNEGVALDAPVVASAQTEPVEPLETQPVTENSNSPCAENKCRTTMKEFQQKIYNLEEELCQAHEEYSSRISRLETEVSDVRRDNVRVRGERGATQHEARGAGKRAADLLECCRANEIKCNELSTQLSIEKRKVAELETRLKAANMTNRVNKAIKDHYTHKNDIKTCALSKRVCPCPANDWTQPKSSRKRTCDCEQQDSEPINLTPGKATGPGSQIAEEMEETPTPAPRPEACCQVLRDLLESRFAMKMSDDPEICCQDPRMLADAGLPSAPPQEPEAYSEDPQAQTATGLTQQSQEPEIPNEEAQNEMETKTTAGTDQEPQGPQVAGEASEKTAQTDDVSVKQDRGDEALAQSPTDDAKDVAEPTQARKSSVCTCLCAPQEGLENVPNDGKCFCACQPLQDLNQDSSSIKGSGCLCVCPSHFDLESTPASNFVCGCPSRGEVNAPSKETNIEGVDSQPGSPGSEDVTPKKPLDDSGYMDANRSPDVPNEINERVRTSRQEYRRVSITATPFKPYDSVRMNEPFDDPITKRNKDKEEERYLKRMNEELMRTILDLQGQVDRMRITEAQLTGVCGMKNCGGKTGDTKSEDTCGTSCGHSEASGYAHKPSEEPGKRQPEPPLRSIDDYASLKKAKQGNTSIEFAYGLQQELPQPLTHSDKNRLFESLTYETKVQVKPEFYTDQYKQQQRAGKSKVPASECARCRESDEFSVNTDATGDRDICEHCDVCTDDKECQSRQYGDKDGADAKTASVKSDRHNSFQIPGPIPVAETAHKDFKKNAFRRLSLDAKKKDSQKNKDKNDKRNKEKDTEHGTQKRGSNLKTGSDSITFDANVPFEIDENVKALREARRVYKAQSKDSIETTRTSFRLPLPGQESLNNFYGPSAQNMFPTIGAEPNPNINKNENQPPHALTFQEANLQEQNRATQVELQENLPRQKTPTSDRETYTVETRKESRATSPDNTEYEISHMSDLPSERDAKSPRNRRLSPGEDKMTTTYTDSYTSPATNYSLSEGEMPASSTRRLSLNGRGEQTPIIRDGAPPTQKMEEALEAITEELARCKNLMLSQRPTDATGGETRPEAKTELRPSVVRRRSPQLGPRRTTPLLPLPASPPPSPPHFRQSLHPPASILSQTSPRRSLLAELHPRRLPNTEDKTDLSLELELQQQRLSSQDKSSQQTTSQELQHSQQKSILHTDTHAKEPTIPDPASLDRTIALRRGIATQSIGDAHPPKCLFTLHIGTVVLSDEAVINSRNKSLVLMWKFYDQNVAMTRVHPGRVVLFDFSTEYDVKITDEFMNYMKHEEMPILICELDKQDEPFATCALPLRDALLHTNRRADMSLALIAGPQMLSARAENDAAADALDAGDEMGVIDLWCLLRAEGNVLPLINRSIAQPSAAKAMAGSRQSGMRYMQQAMDDEPANELRDLDITRSLFPTTNEDQADSPYRDVGYMRNARRWGSSMLRLPATYEIDAVHEYASDSQKMTPDEAASESLAAAAVADARAAAIRRAEELYDPSNYPPVRQCSSDAPISPSDEPERDTSRIIPNEVVAKIRSPGDMKQALVQQSSQQSDIPRLPRPDDDIASQAQSSMGSLKSIVAKLQKKGHAKSGFQNPNWSADPRHSLLQTMMGKYGKGQGNMIDMPAGKCPSDLKPLDVVDEQPDIDIYRKYDNISKLLGSNKPEQKKSVTILPKFVEAISRPKDGTENNRDEMTPAQTLDITILWLALNEECEAMVDPHVQRVYVAYSFLGRTGADLETPVSLPKPKHYVDKCYFNFKKTFELEDGDLPLLGHMARCRAASKVSEDAKDCIVFTVVSEPPEDPLGLESCEDIGYAFLYLGDLLAYSAGSPGYTEVVPVRAAAGGAAVCGVLAVRLDGLDVVRRCLQLSSSQRDLAQWAAV